MRAARAARVCAIVGALAVSSVVAVSPARAEDESSESQVRRGYQIVPPGVFLNLDGRNRALVGLGSYIVNTGGCNDCHTHPSYLSGGNPYLGQPELVNYQQYMTGGKTFGPIITSANLTPDGTGKPAGLSKVEVPPSLLKGDAEESEEPLWFLPWLDEWNVPANET